MEPEILKCRPDFESVKDILIRFDTYITALDVLDKRWSDIKNSESSDFDKIYSFKGEEKHTLEWFYSEGRQLTGDLRHHIQLWTATERFPTFKSFIDHLENRWTKYLPEVKEDYEKAREKAEKIQWPPLAVVPYGIRTFSEVLNIFEGIAVCVNIAKNAKLYRMEAGEYMEEHKPESTNITFHGPVGNIGNVTGNASNSQITTGQEKIANIASQKKGGKGILGAIWDYIKRIISGN